MSSRKRLERKKQERKKQERKSGRINIWQNRIAEALVILVLCVHPLYLNSHRYIRLTYHKFVFFTIYMGAIFLAVFLIWCVRWMRGYKVLPGQKLSVADWAILGFGAVTLISAFFSPYKGSTNIWIGLAERYDGVITQLLYVLAFFIVSRWYKPHERDFGFFAISAILVALIGIFQFYGMDFFKLWPNYIEMYRVENFYHIYFRSTLGHNDIVATYVCLVILLCGFLFVRTKSRWQYVWLASSALNFWLMELAGRYSGMVGTVFTVYLAMPFIVETRKHLGRFLILASSWVWIHALQKLLYDVGVLKGGAAGCLSLFAAGAALLVGGIALLKWKGNPTTRQKSNEDRAGVPAKWKLGVIIIAAVAVVGLMGVEVLGRRGPGNRFRVVGITYQNIAYQIREVMHGNITDDLGTNRVYIWRNALAVFPRHPVFGSGPDTFGQVFPKEAQGRYGEFYDKAHNEYLQILICQGLLGLVCYLVFLGTLFVTSLSKAFGNPLLMAVLAAFTGYCVQAFFNISVPIATQMFWIFAGLLAMGKRFSLPSDVVTR